MKENKFINELISQLNQKIIQDCLCREIINKKQEECDLYKHYNELSVEREKRYSDMCDTWSEQVKLRDKIIEDYKEMLNKAYDREDYCRAKMTEYMVKVINLYKISFWNRLFFVFNPFHVDNTLLDKINKDDIDEIYENKVQD